MRGLPPWFPQPGRRRQQGIPKLIVIHGWGGSFAEALRTIRALDAFPVSWKDGVFRVPRRIALILRDILATPDADETTIAFQKLIVSTLLASSGKPEEDHDQRVDPEQAYPFTERRLIQDFGDFGLPQGPYARERRAEQLRDEAISALTDLVPLLDALEAELLPQTGPRPSEAAARELIHARTAAHPHARHLAHLLETIRDMHESGGDLDTVASATMYTLHLTADAAARRQPFRHGEDYRYVYVNYHESLRDLATHGPALVYMADLPIGAFPDFAEDARYLHAQGLTIARFEDHHPYTPQHRAMLQELQDEGVLQVCALDVPADGSEAANPRCAADMVYEHLVQGTAADTPGARTLRDAAHSEDLVTDRRAFGRMLTTLIKGGICKTELVQLLVRSAAHDDALELLAEAGWDKLPQAWEAGYEEQRETLMENAYVLKLARPAGGTAEQGARALGPGSDTPEPVRAKDEPEHDIRILVALAPRSISGTPRFTTGKALETFAQKVPDADYVFYCYGASIMVARRLNQADFSINLGKLMPLIGSPSDGGHPGAAVCRPESAPDYPSQILTRITPANFHRFVRYLSDRLKRAGYVGDVLENRSRPMTRQRVNHGGKKLALVAAAAALLGIILMILIPSLRPSAIRESNIDFFPRIDQAEAMAVDDMGPPDAPDSPHGPETEGVSP